MKNMDYLQAGLSARGQIGPGPRDIYICLYASLGSPVTGERPARSVPGIADQRFPRPEQDHQHDAQNAHDGKNRLVQHHLDHAVPEPGNVTLDPSPKGLLAGLMDIVPELAEPGEAQVLV